MKKIKLMIGCVLIVLGLVIIGESHHFYLDNFMNYLPSTTLYLQNDLSEGEMKKDVLSSAKKHNIEFFMIDSIVKSTFYKEIKIYTSNSVAKTYLEKELHIKEKMYQSVFSGIMEVNYESYQEITALEDNYTYYVIGDRDNIRAFKMELIDKYAGNHPDYGADNKETKGLILMVWILVYAFLLMLTLYDILLQQKEIFIKIVYGERIYVMVLKNAFMDVFFYSVILVIAYFILKNFTSCDFYNNLTATMFFIFIILNSLLYLKILFLDMRQAVTASGFSTKILLPTYGIKGISVLIFMLVISSNLVVIFHAVDYSAQKEFFEQYSEYYYTNLGYKPSNVDGVIDAKLDQNSILREEFYQKYFEIFKPIILTKFGELKKQDIILANINAKEYLSTVIPEIEKRLKEEKYYFIFPEEMENTDMATETILLQMENYQEVDKYSNYEILEYKGNYRVLNIDEMYENGSKYSKNPIIILDNTTSTYASESIKSYPFRNNYEHDIMFKIDEKTFENFVKENGLENHFHAITNVLEKYNYNWLILKRILYINSVFVVLILLLEIIIIRTIVGLEFKVNSLEFSIKRILGYDFFERYGRIIKISALGCIVSTVIGVVVGVLLGSLYWPYFILCGISIGCIEMLVIRTVILKIEKANVSNILKGAFI